MNKGSSSVEEHKGAFDPVLRDISAAPPPPAPITAAKMAIARPDAAPKKLDTGLRVAVHATILLSVLAFVVYYCVWSPVRGELMTKRESATVTVVALPLTAVRAPYVSGVFVAERAFSNGAYVKSGQILGQISSPELEAQIERQDIELQLLEAQLLQPRQQGSDTQLGLQQAQDARDMSFKVATASKLLEQLNKRKKQLIVRAPCDGFIQFGLAGSQVVAPYKELVSLYPHRTELMIEITAPIEVINDLEGQNRVITQFSTASGKLNIESKPIQASSRSFIKTIEGKRDETWGTIQCAPSFVPLPLRSPGLIGKLQ